MESKPPIQEMAERLLTAKGMDYAFAQAVLKSHLIAISDDKFIAEVARVTNSRIFGKLWSMGLNYRRQQACVARATELEGMVTE